MLSTANEPSVSASMAAAAHAPVLTDDNFGPLVEQASGVVLVDFGADWCPPCRLMAPIIEQLAADYAGRATIATIDVDANLETIRRYNVRSFPTFLFFRDGEVVERIYGAVPRARLAARLDELLATSVESATSLR